MKYNVDYLDGLILGKYKNIGVMGGSFSPITYSHIMTMIRSAEMRDLDCVIIEPVGDYYKKDGLVSIEDRMAILEKAIEEIRPQVDFEILIGCFEAEAMFQPSTYETMSYYKTLCETYTKDVRLSYICGSDLLEGMGQYWVGDVVKLVSEFTIICLDRVETGKNVEFDIINKSELLFKNRRNIKIIPAMTYNEISSTLIRYRVKYGMSLVGLVPTSAIGLIKEVYNEG